MSDYIVNLENVTMKFNLVSEHVDSLKDYLIKVSKHKLFYEEFYALKNISLQIKKGDSFGIVGLNGSGKSTLLKVISGIYKPTEGKVEVKGRIAPLIELGAGFDPELTAKENVFLNGSLLGHSKKFMQDCYDEIIEFAELEDFVDVPIKNFSSGMTARLGFSIATMVKPDILIVDEALSVGDFKFQEKCEKKISDILSKGTTLIFVSHSIEQVKQMCKNCVWIEKGIIKAIGNSKQVCNEYIEYNS